MSGNCLHGDHVPANRVTHGLGQQLHGSGVLSVAAQDSGNRRRRHTRRPRQIPRQPALGREVGTELGDVEPMGCFHLFPDDTRLGNVCQHQMLPTVTAPSRGRVDSARMAATAQRALVFGQLLKWLRDDTFKKRTSLRSAEVATASTIRPLSHTAFRNYEEGRIPGLPQIHAMASAYGVAWNDLAAALLEDLQRDDATVEELLAIAKPAAVEDRAAPDLVELETPEGATEFIAVPILSNRIAAGNALRVDPHDVAGYAAFSPKLLKRLGVKPADAVLVRVGWVQRSMSPTIKPDDIVLLDCSEGKRMHPQNGEIYAVNIQDEGSALKRVVIVDNLMSLISDNLDKSEYPILPPMDITDRFIQGLIVGKVVWWGNALL